MTKRRKITISGIIVSVIIVICLVPYSTGINDAGKRIAVSKSLEALLKDKRVLTGKGFIRLYDSSFVENDGRLYFNNGLGIPDSVFIEHGLKPIPKDRKLDVDNGDVIISFSFKDDGKGTDNIQFSYIFGSLGAQGYEIRIYRSLLCRYIVYLHRWVS